MLTDTAIKRAATKDKAYKLSDSGGLYIHITPAGGKHWRLKYRFGGSEKLLSIGPYPAISLLEARKARDSAKAALRDGKDPSVLKKLHKLTTAQNSEDTFEVVAREWFELNRSKWIEHHADDVIRSLENDIFPHIGNLPIRDISAPLVLASLRLVEQRDAADTARRIRQRMSAIFVYAISSGKAETDPAAVVLGAMAPVSKGRLPAITKLTDAKAMLKRVEQETAHPVTKLAHRLLALTALRPGVIASTPWHEFDAIEDDLWLVPASRMKLKLAQKQDEARDHLVPVTTQVREVIDSLRTLTGRGPLAFPNQRHAHKPMSENAIGYLLNRAGYHGKHVPHGWRSTFSTHMNETFPADRAIVDLMLAHVPKDRVESAYNRALHIGRRKELAQIWADIILEGAPAASELLKGPRR